MDRFRGLSRGGRVLLALAVGEALFGIASAVLASIPSANGVIHGCYGKAGTPYKDSFGCGTRIRASSAATTRTRSTGVRPARPAP